MDTIESTVARYTLRDDGIVVTRAINPEVPRTRETAAATLDVLAEFIGEERKPMLWDQRATPRLSPQVWVEVIQRVERLAVAVAFVTDEGTGHEQGSFQKAISLLLIPTRTFSAEAPAIAWLQQFRD